VNAQPDPKKNEFLAFRDEGDTGQPALDIDARKRLLGRLTPMQWVAVGIGLLLAIIAVVWATRSPSGPPPTAGAGNESLALVSVMTPRSSVVKSTVTFSGAIGARYDIPIGVEGEGGRITAVLVEAGDTVRQGQALARLDQSVLRPQLNRLAATVEEARAQATLSSAEYGRALSVESAGALSKEEVERRRATAAADEARVKVAAAQLAEAEARLSRAEIRAPADGIVLTRDAEVGQTAAPAGPPLFRLARGGEIEMRGQIAEQDLPKLEVDQSVAVYLTGVAEPFTGKVRLLGAVIDPATRLGEVRVALPLDPRLRPGAFARGEANVGEAAHPILPKSAVLIDGTRAYVMVVNASGIVERRPVKVGQVSAQGIAIYEGLTGDERIVTMAAGFLHEGEKVEIATAKAAAP